MDPTTEMQLDTDVRCLLERRRGEWRKIAEEAQVSHSWISQFVRGLIPNPGYATLRDLRAYLVEGAKTRNAGVAE